MITREYPASPYIPLFENKKLEDFLNPNHPLVILSKNILWDRLEDCCAKSYSDSMGRTSKPVRLMVGLLLLKYIYGLSDERVVATWAENVYYQAFTGQTSFVTEKPCDASLLSVFRKKILGKEGCEIIFSESVRIHGTKILEDYGLIDTTVQEKAITFPTDAKLILKAIDYILTKANFLEMSFDRTYKNEIKELKNRINFGRNSIDQSVKERDIDRLREIANTLLNSFQEQLSPNSLKLYPIRHIIMLLEKAINQGKQDKNKIYSIHEPQTQCIAKGKAHKKYEFGSKVSFIVTKNKGIVLGALNFKNNPYDGDTIAPAIDQIKRLHNGYKPETLIGDRGYRGRPEVKGVNILTPWDIRKEQQTSVIRKNKNLLRKRTSIEPIIGHLKTDHRLGRNFLKGTLGDFINPLLSAAAFNFLKYARVEYTKLNRPPKPLAILPRQKRRKVTTFYNLPLWRKERNPLF
jgi:IS5 family transposase